MQQAFLEQAQSEVQVAGVVDLKLALDAQFHHAGGNLAHLEGRVPELELAEGHGAEVEAGHARLQLDQAGALLVGEEAAGGELRQNRAGLVNGVQNLLGAAVVGGGQAVGAAGMDVNHRSAFRINRLGLFGELLGGVGKIRIVARDCNRAVNSSGNDYFDPSGSLLFHGIRLLLNAIPRF